MFAGAISIILLGLSIALNARSYGNVLNVSISADPSLHGLICVDKRIVFTCKVTNVTEGASVQYQWSIGDGQPKIGNNTLSMRVSSLSTINVTCEAYGHGVSTQYGKDTITIKPTGVAPQIDFQYVTNRFVYKLTGSPFTLTATVVSDLNLSLYWIPPESPDPVSSKTITVHHGNMINTTFMLLKNATLGDSGNYTIAAVNECGASSSQVDVEVTTDCPPPNFSMVQPMENFTAVEGYNATMNCSYDGLYSATSLLLVWVLFPHSQKPQYIHESPYNDCKCWAEDRPACPIGINPNSDCCGFELVIHSTPVLNDSGTVFSCTESFAEDTTAWMFVVPSPKVLEPPRSLSTTAGSKAVFTCDFEASTDNKIAQIHWEFNGDDLAGCRRFQDRINCTVTQNSIDTNYISSTLEIYSVQAENDGRYTCYCSYNTSILNVDGIQVIQSDRKSATLSLHSGPSHGKNLLTISVSVGILLSIIFIITVVTYRAYVYDRRSMYMRLPGQDELLPPEITDEILDRYIVPGLLPFWEKLGKALNLPNDFLEGDLPADPAERLKAVLREWQATEDHPLVYTLNKKLEQLGLKNFIPQ